MSRPGYVDKRGNNVSRQRRRKERRGGRREITDYVDENPPPVWRDWLVEWHAARREQEEAV